MAAGSGFGNLFRVTTWGESHGKGIGVVVDGCPAGLSLCEDDIQIYLNRRKPGTSRFTTPRKEDDEVDPSLAFGAMFVLAIATSIDALAVGVTLALLNVNILATVLSIGLCTFIISTIGVKIGNVFGMKFKSKAELLGGVVLILIGLKILLEHLGIIAF